MNIEPETSYKLPSRSFIFLKASVIALGIVFVVLFAALIILKAKKPEQKKVVSCEDTIKTGIAAEVQTMSIQGDKIIILTKLNPKTGIQEIIKFDSNCSKITNRIELNVF